jgi:hypothetical protein
VASRVGPEILAILGTSEPDREMSAAKEQDTLFPTIGNVAEQTGLLSDGDEGKKDEGDLNEDEDRPVQEVTSLCMVCHEQVCLRIT